MVRRLASALIVACLLPLGAAAGEYAESNGQVRIVNLAVERVVEGEVEICNQHFKLSDLEPGESKIITYDVKSDSHYRIKIRFESGRILEKELGYVTNGMEFRDSLIVGSGDIALAR